MNAEKDWLAMLDKATSYSDLQNAFARMSAESKSTGDGNSLAASIDEAIRRIEQERGRDQAELDGVSSEYDAFKQQQSGVIGWFKRKLPFTETRKQELGHRDALNDQAAEILADNFVIARAQMLKEQVASPKLRRMGEQTSYWRNQLLQQDSIGTIREYGNVVHALGLELSVAKQFIDTVSVDIDAFAGAKFVNKEDQLRRNADLISAGGELKALVGESQEKANLRSAALVTLKNLLISELSEKDVDFRNVNQRLILLRSLQEKLPKITKLMEERLALVTKLVSKSVEKDSLFEKRERLEKEVRSLQSELEETEQKRMHAAREFDQPSQLYQAALRESQQAKAALSAAKPLYDAYLAEQNRAASNDAELNSESDFEVSASNVLVEYRRLEEAATESAQALLNKTPAYEQAKRAQDQVVQAAKAIRDKTEALTLEIKKLANLESELQQDLLKTKQSIESTSPELRTATEAYLDDASKVTWSDSLGASVRALQELAHDARHYGNSPTSFPVGRTFSNTIAANELAERKRDSERLTKVIHALGIDRKGCLNEFATLSKLRKEGLQQRGQMLLDHGVCSELDLE